MRDQSLDATAEVQVRGTLEAREIPRRFDIMSADPLRILVHKARCLNAGQKPQGE
jgi:hypothetical protein